MVLDASVEKLDREADVPAIDDRTDHMLMGLCSWLERATHLEGQAHQPRNVLSMGALTAGTGFAVVPLAAGKPWLGISAMTLFAICAVAMFHMYDRQATIRKKVARELQKNQKAVIEGGKAAHGLKTAEDHALAFWPDEGIHVLTGRALAFYLMAAVMLAPIVLFVLFEKKVETKAEQAAKETAAPVTPMKKPSLEQ